MEALIEAELARAPVADWCARFSVAGVPAGPVNSAGQALEHEQTRAVGMVIDVPDGEGGMARGIGSPLTLSGKAEAALTPAPRVGEHSSAVLREYGFSEADIAALIQARVIQQG